MGPSLRDMNLAEWSGTCRASVGGNKEAGRPGFSSTYRIVPTTRKVRLGFILRVSQEKLTNLIAHNIAGDVLIVFQ